MIASLLLAGPFILTACQAPPVAGDSVPAPGPRPRVSSAEAAVGDGAAAWDDARPGRATEKKPDVAAGTGLARAKALADAGEHASASAAYDSRNPSSL